MTLESAVKTAGLNLLPMRRIRAPNIDFVSMAGKKFPTLRRDFNPTTCMGLANSLSRLAFDWQDARGAAAAGRKLLSTNCMWERFTPCGTFQASRSGSTIWRSRSHGD